MGVPPSTTVRSRSFHDLPAVAALSVRASRAGDVRTAGSAAADGRRRRDDAGLVDADGDRPGDIAGRVWPDLVRMDRHCRGGGVKYQAAAAVPYNDRQRVAAALCEQLRIMAIARRVTPDWETLTVMAQRSGWMGAGGGCSSSPPPWTVSESQAVVPRSSRGDYPNI